jgi:beta-aspartyl-peptidase (threonine type)
MKIVMAKGAVDLLGWPLERNESATDRAQFVAKNSVQHLAERGRGTGGIIVLDMLGNPGFAFNTPRMAYGYVDSSGSFVVGV